VAWDPQGKFIVTQSSDRTARIYSRKTSTGKDFTSFQILKYLELNTQKNETNTEATDGAGATQKKRRLFASDAVGTFFRRLCWSPDGSLLFTPCGIWQEKPEDPIVYTTFVWSRHNFSKYVTVC